MLIRTGNSAGAPYKHTWIRRKTADLNPPRDLTAMGVFLLIDEKGNEMTALQM